MSAIFSISFLSNKKYMFIYLNLIYLFIYLFIYVFFFVCLFYFSFFITRTQITVYVYWVQVYNK